MLESFPVKETGTPKPASTLNKGSACHFKLAICAKFAASMAILISWVIRHRQIAILLSVNGR
eukprot:1037685-Pelagomonas_calceolata.AAC.1